MSRTLWVDPRRPEEAAPALDSAAEAIEAGELVVFPTETVYGLAARPDASTATARVFEAKGRPFALNLPVLAPSVASAWEVGERVPAAEALASSLWPGPLTLVLRRGKRSRGWELGEQADSVAVRVPDHPLTLALLARTGPLAATSANVSGRPPLEDPAAIAATFGETVAVILALAPTAPRPAGVASTVVDCTGIRVRILRTGSIRADAVRELLPGVPVED